MVCIVGAGNMGQAIAAGLIEAGERDVVLVERNPVRREHLAERFGPGHCSVTPVASDVAVLAVKPKDIPLAAQQAVDAGNRRVLSVATGVGLARLSQLCGPEVEVARAMPNIGAALRRSATGVCGDEPATEWASQIMRAVGSVEIVPEVDIHAVTAAAGSGPAYIFAVAAALARAGAEAGLEPAVALRLARQTISAAAALLDADSGDPQQLQARVATKGGTTEAGLGVLVESNIDQIFSAAVAAARTRSQELSQEHNP